MDVNEDNQLVSTRLEEQMFDIAEEHIHVFVPKWRHVSKTVLMYLDFTRNALTIQRRPKVDVR
jgi:hypothetical protein